MWLLVGLALVARISASDFPIDNEIVGEPTIDCEDTLVGLTFKTKKPFTGRVYVQGLSDDDRCSNAFVDNRNMSRMSMQVKTGDCTMQRHRVTGKLEGLMFTVTIIVSFHGTFVTKADRAFRCICFFRNQKTLTNSIQIGSLGTTELLNPIAPPSCSYEIRSGSPSGPLVVNGEIGEKIFHIWHCDAPGKGFLVHSCKVTDGRGFQFDLLDVDGCAVDPVIQPDLAYDEEANTAVAETFGYKFSDTNVLNYECIVEICSRTMGECSEMTPPMCDREPTNRLLRRRRSTIMMKEAGSVEVAASISMMDSMKQAVVKDEDLPQQVQDDMELETSTEKQMESPRQTFAVCLNSIQLTILTTALTFFFLLVVTLAYLYSRVHKYYFNHHKVRFETPKDEKMNNSHVSNISVSSASV